MPGASVIAAGIPATGGGISEFQPAIATAAPTTQILVSHHEDRAAGIHPTSGYTRGYVEDNKIAYWQVSIKIGFTVE